MVMRHGIVGGAQPYKKRKPPKKKPKKINSHPVSIEDDSSISVELEVIEVASISESEENI